MAWIFVNGSYYYYFTVETEAITSHRRKALDTVMFLYDVDRVGRSVIMCCGRLFQIVGAAWQKVPFANADLTQSTRSRPRPSDHIWRVEA